MNITERLAAFSKEMLEAYAWGYSDPDGGHVQDLAERYQLIRKVPYDPEVHGESEYDVEPGEDWFVFAPEFLDALPSLPSSGAGKEEVGK